MVWRKRGQIIRLLELIINIGKADDYSTAKSDRPILSDLDFIFFINNKTNKLFRASM
jgi:hypothetical protein